MEVPFETKATNVQEAWEEYETVFTNAKAGMACVDKEHVKRIVYEMSKVSVSASTAIYENRREQPV